ncbi:GDP-mannose 4,6-dehydratase [Candidatus Margulisiibacteriota bacterium]
MKALITGVTGFVGSHLAELLLEKKAQVSATYRWRSRMENIEAFRDKIELHECDIRDAVAVRSLIDKVKPDHIYHLAAQSFVGASWVAPAETLSTNIMGELNLFEAVKAAGINPRILVAGSSEEYGLVKKDEVPVSEDNPLRPLSPYAVSKVTQDFLGYQYFKSYGIPIIRTRAFNHTGPRRGDVFVCSNFAKQIVMMEKKMMKPVLVVGNLKAKRDFTDVRDMIRAYWLAINKCDAGDVYNIASGNSISIKELIDIFIRISGVKFEVKSDPQKMRPSDVEILQGDSSKFRKKTGWKPEIPFEQTLKDLLDYWRKKLA